MKLFIATIAIIGVIRFALNAAGLPNDIVRYFSMSVIMLVAFVYFALTAQTHKERLKDAYLIVLPYMTIEVLALSYTWATGRSTIFQAAEYARGFSISRHTIGHFVGGLTWEPLLGFLLMELVWGVYAGGRILLKPKVTPVG